MGIVKIEGKEVTLDDDVIRAGEEAVRQVLSASGFPAASVAKVKIDKPSKPGAPSIVTVSPRSTGKGAALEDIGEIAPEGGLMLLPCKPDVCQECAVDHTPDLPHNNQSLYYQYHFYFKHGRWPTWKDAMAHCTDEMKAFWIEQLGKMGAEVEK
jgi:hypothetical protein